MKHFSKGNSKQHDIEKLSNPFVFKFFNRLDNNVLRFLIIEEPLRNIYSQGIIKIISKTDIFCSKRLHLCLIYRNKSYNIKG